MAKVLACTDGSVYAASVYDHAAWAAVRLSAGVRVLHALDHARDRAAAADLSGSIGIDAREDLLEELTRLDEARGRLARRTSKLILQDAGSRLLSAGVTDVTLTQRHGSLVETLDAFEDGAELIVIGKRGEAADFATLHLGANIERVIRASRRPVLVASRAFRPVERFLIAFDGGPSARKAVEYASRKPLLKGLECHLVMAGRPVAGHEEVLAGACDTLERSGLTVCPALLPGEPEEVIAAQVAERDIGLLVMGAYGHSRIRQLIVGSTTTTMIRTCQVPVLMFR
ncbi:universal stress protein [Azospirillum halopraeferens]|uniref:universal stress protein n=1 Tax=Azospirillum halopraeferens TaxID=34010 RepID=UPI000401D6E0|nr:universal stress protein [Azospirillum halopraeferens]